MSNSSATPWTVAYQAPLSMGFSRQEYWSGLPFSSPGDLPDPRIEPISPGLVGGFFTTEPSGKSQRDREKSQIQKASKALVYLVNHQVDSLDLFLSWASLVAQMVKKKKKKKYACNAGDPGTNPGSGRSPGEENGNLLQYSCLENSTDKGVWRATVHGVVKSWTGLST